MPIKVGIDKLKEGTTMAAIFTNASNSKDSGECEIICKVLHVNDISDNDIFDEYDLPFYRIIFNNNMINALETEVKIK